MAPPTNDDIDFTTLKPPAANGLILLVEDNASDEKLTLRSLRNGQVPAMVCVCRDGREALQFLQDDSQPVPDLVFLDIKLPQINGLEVLEHIRKSGRTEGVPVVMLTSSDDMYDIAMSYRLGANSYIRKTEDFDQFMEHVRLAGLYWMVVNRVLNSLQPGEEPNKPV